MHISLALVFSILTVIALIVPAVNVPVGGTFGLALIFAILTVVFLVVGI